MWWSGCGASQILKVWILWDLERGGPGLKAAFADDVRCGLGLMSLFALNEV